MNFVERSIRRARYGEPIIVVSGLPRSGTSMAMKMLEAGGVPLLTDGVRIPDESNPHGYFEFEPVKQLDKGDVFWLREAHGKAVKIVSSLLTWLPETCDYRVVFMRRDLDEMIASQDKMLVRRGQLAETTGRESTRAMYARHLEQVERFLSTRKCFRSITVNYRTAVEYPAAEARRISEFLGLPLDIDRMVAAVDRHLYRNRITDGAFDVPSDRL